MKKLLSLLILVILGFHGFSLPITGTKTIGVDYPTLAAAIADLNLQGAGTGGVTFNIPANYTETFNTPTDGIITTITGSSANPIIFQKSGTGVNPVITPAAGTGTLDAIIAVAGTDYVTFDGINLSENPLNTTATTQAEFGYAILKASATDGSQNIIVRNCTVTLNKDYTATNGIYSNNHILTSNAVLAVTAVSGANSNLKIYSNTVTAYTGITVTGYNDAVVPYTFLDQNNEIGKDGANNILNVAGQGAAGYGIYASGQNNLKVANNNINSTMAGAGGPTGIYLTNGRNASYDLYGNTVTLKYSGTGTSNLYGIWSDLGVSGSNNTMNIYNNTVTGCTFSTMTSGYFYGLYATNVAATINVYGNNIVNNTIGSTTATAIGRIWYLYINRISPLSGPMSFYNNSVTGNTRIQSIPGAGLTYGLSTVGNVSPLNSYNNTFSDNVIASNGGTYGMYISNNGPKSIYNNTICNLTKAEGITYGIYMTTSATGSGDGYVYRNKIMNIEGLTSGATIYGIYANSSGNGTYYYNNFIGDFRTPNATSGNSISGIYNNAGTPSAFYYNTVFLNATSTGVNFGTSAVYSSSSAPLDLRNNLLINTSTAAGTGRTCVLRFSTGTITNFSQLSNYNDLYVPAGALNYFFYDGSTGDQTFTAYKQRVSPREVQSISELAPFVSTTAGSADLHIKNNVPTGIEAGGVTISNIVSVINDFDLNSRYPNSGYPVGGFTPSAPDMGADEFGGLSVDNVVPAINVTPLTNTNVAGPRTLNVGITDGTGIPISGIGLPKLYWNINGGAWQNVTATFVSQGNYSFTFGSGANIGDVVNYYIVVQDLAGTPNVAASPASGASGFTINPPACSALPTSPYSYTIMASISGVKHVGVGKDYVNLTAATTDVNNKWITGPVTLVLDDPTYPSESYPVTIGANPGSSSTNTLTIKPNTGVSVLLATNSPFGLFNLNGIDYLTIDGSNNGTGSQNLTISNYSTTSGSYALSFGNTNSDPSTRITLKNTIFSCTPVHSSVVDITVIRTITTTGGINDITIDHNIIRAGFNGIRNSGVSGGINSNWVIKNNLIGSVPDSLAITSAGVITTYADNTLITNNEIMGPVSGSLNPGQTGVYVGNNSTSTKISNNKIHDFIRTSDDGWGVSGIWYVAEASSVTEILNNVIYNISSPGMNPGVGQNISYGIFFRTGGNARIIHNSIYMNVPLSASLDASSACLGFYSAASAGNNEVRNNIFKNSSTLTGTNMYGRAYGIVISQPASLMFSVIDNNDYYIDGYNGCIGMQWTNGLGFAGTYPTIADWRTYTGQEVNSTIVNPAFTSATNLVPTTTQMPNAGFYMSNVTTDINGTVRSNPPDIGAYEFTVDPVITTVPATSVMYATADLHGSGNAQNYTFNLFFDYGTTTSYGTSVAATPATITGTASNSFGVSLSALAPLTTYHFRARGVTSTGVTVYGADMTFTTIAAPPSVVTTAATSVTSTGAVLNGTVNANSASTVVTFEYGTTTAYGTVVSATPGSLTGTMVTPVSATLSSLLPNQIYHYRAIGVNSTGTSYGADMTFTTPAVQAAVITNIASTIGSNNATLNGTVTANNAGTTVTFEWGLTTAYGNTATATPGTVNGMSATAVSAVLSSLLINTTYHYRCVGVNVAGTTYGADQIFTTNCVAPVISVSGPATACASSTGNVYTSQAGNTNYTWVASAGGTITSGAGTNSISVTWNTTGAQNVSLNYTNSFGCSALTPAVYNVNVNATPSPTVTGPASVCTGTTSNTYTTQAGMSSYNWTVSAGGTITSGAGTNTIQVTWNTAGAQNVSVNYNNANGCPAPVATVYNVSVNALPVPTISGQASLCVNSGYYTYSTEAGMSSYNWTVSPGGSITAGQGTNQIQVSWTGSGAQTVSVNYNNATGCGASTPTSYAVTVNPAPGQTGAITGTSSVCAGTTGVSYSVAPVANAVAYVWSLPAGASIASGSGTNSIVVDFGTSAVSGDITVYANNLCGNGTTSPVFPVTVNAIPATAGTIHGDNSVCEGETGVAYYVDPIANATNYNWVLPAGVNMVSGAGTASIIVNFTANAASGNISVNGSNSCGNGNASSLAVSVNEIPQTPVITLNGSVLSSSAVSGNQWYKNGNAISGATGQTHDAAITGTGWYTTIVSNGGCASDSSNSIYVVITGTDELTVNGFNIYPVPNNGKFTVELSGAVKEEMDIKVISTTGAVIYTRNNVEKVFTVDMGPVSDGMYNVLITNGKSSIMKKIVVRK